MFVVRIFMSDNWCWSPILRRACRNKTETVFPRAQVHFNHKLKEICGIPLRTPKQVAGRMPHQLLLAVRLPLSNPCHCITLSDRSETNYLAKRCFSEQFSSGDDIKTFFNLLISLPLFFLPFISTS
jgi:hypothetical protein